MHTAQGARSSQWTDNLLKESTINNHLYLVSGDISTNVLAAKSVLDLVIKIGRAHV